MSGRFPRLIYPTLVGLVLLLGVMVGCGGKGPAVVPPTITIEGIRTVEFNTIIPVVLWINSKDDMDVQLALSYKDETSQAYKRASSVPGRIDPSKLRKVLVRSGGTKVIFYWNAIADLPTGHRHEQVLFRAMATTTDGEVAENFFGPFIMDHSAGFLGSLPPYVAGGVLPSTECGVPYSAKLTAQGGEAPLVWSVYPQGTQLPYFLEMTFDGIVRGNIPAKYGPTTLSFVALATDSNKSNPRSSAGLFTISIGCETVLPCGQPPSILFAGVPGATVNELYSFQATAAGGYGDLKWSKLSGALPSGFEFDSNGLLSGTPASDSAGVYQFTLEVCDSCPQGPQCDTATVKLEVVGKATDCGEAPKITTPSLIGATENSPYSQQLKETGGFGSLSWSIIGSGTLPLGMALTQAGLLTGTPEPGTGGETGQDYVFTAQLSDSCPNGVRHDSKEYTLHVAIENPCTAPPPIITTASPLPDATTGTAYNTTLTASDGQLPLHWVLNNPTDLPTGLNFDAAGHITGTPALGTQGTVILQVTVNDSCSTVQSNNKDLTLNIIGGCAPAPQITTATLPHAVEGQAYDFQFSAVGGEGSLSWVQEGAPPFPADLVLEATGELHGIPQIGTAGDHSGILVRVADQCGIAIQTDQESFNLTVDPKPPCASAPTIDTTSLPQATEGVPYSTNLAASNGEGTLIWEVLPDQDQLPASLSLSPVGVLDGTPDAGTQGVYNLHIRVSDQCVPVQTDETTLVLTVAGTVPCASPPTNTTGTLPDAKVGTPYSFQFTADGGEGTLTWKSLGTSLPPGMIFDPSGLLHGTPQAGTEGIHQLVIQVCDSCAPEQCSTPTPFPLNITAAGGCAAPPIIQGNLLPNGAVGVDYHFALNAVGGEGTLTWTVLGDGDQLPADMILDSDGTIHGIPQAPGTFNIHIQVCDSCADPSAQCNDKSMPLTIN